MKTIPALQRRLPIVLVFCLCLILSPDLKQHAQTSTSPPTGLNILSIPYYSVKGDWNSTLTLSCAWHEPLTASLTLFSMDGQALSLSDFRLDPFQTMPLRLGELISHVDRRGQFLEGSIQLRYNGPMFGIGAQLTVADVRHSLSFDMEPAPPAFRSSTLEGLWWSHDERTRGMVMICNRASTSVTVLPTVQWNQGAYPVAAIPLSPHQTVVIEIEKMIEELGEHEEGIGVGGLTLTHNGSPGSVIAHGVILNKEARFSSNLDFVDPGSQDSSIIEATGLLLAHPPSGSAFPGSSFFTPILAVKNTTASIQSAAVTVQYSQRGSLRTAALPPVTLSPHEVRLADFSTILSELPDIPIDDAGLRIESAGPPGSVISQLTSVDQTGSMSVDAPLLAVGSGFTGTGAHPFILAGDKQAVLHLKNLGDEPTTAIVQIRFAEGEYSPELIVLAPGESRAIDVRQLRDSQGRDIHGHQLPASLTSGQVRWFQHGQEKLIGHLVFSSVSEGIAANFACPLMCCTTPSFGSLAIEPPLLVGDVDEVIPVVVKEMDISGCDGFSYGPYDVTFKSKIESSDTSVATVSGNQVTLKGAGTTTITAKENADVAAIVEIDPNCGGTRFADPATGGDPTSCTGCSRTLTPESAEAQVVARPKITAISGPRAVAQGLVGNQISLQASVSPAGGTFTWRALNGRVELFNPNSATVTVHSLFPSDLPNDIPVQVVYTKNGVQSIPGVMFITVQRPNSLEIVGSIINRPIECSSSSHGWERIVTRKVVDQFGVVMKYAGMRADEAVIVINGGCFPGPIDTGISQTDALGTFPDRFAFCTSKCPSDCKTLALQEATINGITLPVQFTIVFSCTGITIGGL